MSKRIKSIGRLATILIAILLITWAAYNIQQKEKPSDPIRNAIKKHNEATQEHSNTMFPSVARPANDSVTVYKNDSVRVH